MEERFSQVHDHIAALRAEADAARLVHAGPADAFERTGGHAGRSGGLGFRRRAGRALMALGAIVEGRAERTVRTHRTMSRTTDRAGC